MLKFNNNHIVTGYIKQLLSSFNLPTYYNGKWTGVDDNYYYGKKMLNGNRNYKINSNIYDSYTHEYLGDYLRFTRDIIGIDLMPLYNCFSNRICTSLDLSVKDTNGNYTRYMSTLDNKYKVYMVPVRLGKKYTIALDCSRNVELCCGLYTTHQVKLEEEDTNYIDTLIKSTYTKLNDVKFNAPKLFSKLADNYDTINNSYIINHESALKMFIKVPIENNSSIVILEGDYLAYNSTIYGENVAESKSNHSVINFEYKEACSNFESITNLQLLAINTKDSYPFADRLIEYLIGNVIHEGEDIEDNIIRVQKVMSQNKINKKHISFAVEGLWEDKIKAIAYSAMQKNENKIYNRNHDILGYIDKDVEATYKGKDTLINVDIYPDIYLDSK